MLIVKKFGGTSVANKERIYNVANRCVEEYKKGNDVVVRSEEHTSELQSHSFISYAVFCLKKKINVTEGEEDDVL